MKLACPSCSQTLDVPELGAPAIMNLPAASIVVFEHAQPHVCPCGCAFVPVVGAVKQVGLKAAPVERRLHNPTGIIIPGRQK